MSEFAIYTVAIFVGGPVLIWLAGFIGDRHHDNGTAFGCCVLWLVLAGAWFAQALYNLTEWIS